MDQIAVYGVFRDAGIEEEKAKAIATTLRREFEQGVNSRELATKGDLEQLRLFMQAEIEKSKNETIKWVVGAMLAAVGLATGIAMAIARLFLTAS